MISKPPGTPDIALNTWLQEVRKEFNDYIQVVQVPVSSLGTGAYSLHGKHPSMQVQATETAYFSFIVPHKLRAFKEAGIRIIPTTTGTINYTVNFSYGGVGEDENTLTKTAAVTSKAVTDDQVMELDLPISTFFTDQDPGDQIGIEFILDAATTTTDVHVLSFYIKYI